MTLLDIYDSRRATNLADYALRHGAFYTDRASRVKKSLGDARYVAVFTDSFKAGREPKPYFYVYSVSDVDPLSLAYELNPGYGVDFLTDSVRLSIEEAEFKIVYVFYRRRWVPYKPRRVYKILGNRPEDIIKLREPFLTQDALSKGVYASGFNIKYAARVAWDLPFRILGFKPLWETMEPPSELAVPEAPIHVFDIEVLSDGIYIVSILRHRLLEEPARDDVQVVTCKAGRECDELVKAFRGARIVYGHNILGFDIPHLFRQWFIFDLALASKLDGVKILTAHGQSFQIGASRSLYAVAKRLREAAGITREELETKERSRSILASGDLDQVIKYNVNDVVITAKIANVLLPFIYLVSVITGVPPSVAQEIQAGILAEYLMFRTFEHRGILIGYKNSNADMTGSKVLLPCAVAASQSSLDEFLKILKASA